MTGAELHPLVFKALGPRPAIPAREACLGLLRGAASVALRYEWVVSWPLIEALVARPDVELSDGQEWFSLTVTLNPG